MGLLVECPECKKRNSLKAKACKCGFALAKFPGRVYWIDWYQEGRRKRERIGTSKQAAEQRLREVLTARAEGGHIRKRQDVQTYFKDLVAWYLDLPEVKDKRSYEKDQMHCRRLVAQFGGKLLRDITPAMVEAYKQERLNEPSGLSPKNLNRHATVNRELACLKTIFNKAIKNSWAEVNPVKGVKLLKKNNEREENKIKTIFAVQDPEVGWVGFQTAEDAGAGAIQISCYENLAEFNNARLEKVRQGALAKLTDTEIEGLGLLEKFKLEGPNPTHPDASSTTISEYQAVP